LTVKQALYEPIASTSRAAIAEQKEAPNRQQINKAEARK